MLREVPGKARKGHQLGRQWQHPLEDRVLDIEPRLAHALRQGPARVPPLHDAREAPGLLGRQAKDLAKVAQRAAWAVADDRGGDRSALATVLSIDVLQHL